MRVAHSQARNIGYEISVVLCGQKQSPIDPEQGTLSETMP